MPDFGRKLLIELNIDWSDYYTAYNLLKKYIGHCIEFSRNGVYRDEHGSGRLVNKFTMDNGSSSNSSSSSSINNNSRDTLALECTVSEAAYVASGEFQAFLQHFKKDIDKTNTFFLKQKATLEAEVKKLHSDYEELLITEKKDSVYDGAADADTGSSISSSHSRRVAGSQLKHRIIYVYVTLHLLLEYASLNVSALQKSIKKHDKNMHNIHTVEATLMPLVTSLAYFDASVLLLMQKDIEIFFADFAHGDNLPLAQCELRDAVFKDVRTQPNDVPVDRLSKKAFIIDMDGVLYWQDHLIPGVQQFIQWLERENKDFIFLTNGSCKSPRELSEKLRRYGLNLPESRFYTSAMSTAAFVAEQKPNGSAYVLGDAGLFAALYKAGYTIDDFEPDYVIVGETSNYNYTHMERAINLVRQGARLIGTNVDIYDRATYGISPGTGCLIKPIELATNVKAYYLGKPNPVMFRSALQRLGCSSSDAVMIGDRMDTDIVGGIEAGLETVLVLSGVTSRDDMKNFAYRPHHILSSVLDLVKMANINADNIIAGALPRN